MSASAFAPNSCLARPASLAYGVVLPGWLNRKNCAGLAGVSATARTPLAVVGWLVATVQLLVTTRFVEVWSRKLPVAGQESTT